MKGRALIFLKCVLKQTTCVIMVFALPYLKKMVASPFTSNILSLTIQRMVTYNQSALKIKDWAVMMTSTVLYVSVAHLWSNLWPAYDFCFILHTVVSCWKFYCGTVLALIPDEITRQLCSRGVSAYLYSKQNTYIDIYIII